MNKKAPEKDLGITNHTNITTNDLLHRLIFLIENSSDDKCRLEFLNQLGKIEKKSEELFNFLENLLISDVNEEIRFSALNIILEHYNMAAMETIEWVIRNEYSLKILLHIIKQSKTFNEIKLKEILLSSLYYFVEHNNWDNLKKYQEVLNIMVKKEQLETFSIDKLFEIIHNIKTLSIISKKIRKKFEFGKRIEYEINKGIISNLSLWGLKISSFKEINDVLNLNKVTILELPSNSLEDLSGIENMRWLFHLNLNNNQLTDISRINSLKKLEFLDLSSNKIREIKEPLELPDLKRLNLGNNQLRDLKGIEHLNKLEFLNVEHNLIDNVKELKLLANLKSINLLHNNLREFHISEASKNLEYLSLASNPLESVSGFDRLPKLKELQISDEIFLELRGLEGLRGFLISLYNYDKPYYPLSFKVEQFEEKKIKIKDFLHKFTRI